MANKDNYQNRRIYWKAINRIRASFVRQTRKVWREALEDYLIKDNPLAIDEAMKKTYVEVGGKFARSQRNRLLRQKAYGDVNDEVDDIIVRYVRDEKGGIIKSIKDTSASLYASILADESLTAQEQLKAIEKMIVARSRFLAEQEIVSASNYGDILGADLAEQIGIERGEQFLYVKTWVATIDAVVRDAHADADGQTVRKPEYFNVGGEQLFYPKDPAGSAGNTINCRCTMIVDKIKES
jgi:hypothetical protein